jgi:IS5 family transposase
MLKVNIFHHEGIFGTPLCDLVDQKDPLILLRNAIDWKSLCFRIGEFYDANIGRPSVDLRTLISILLLQRIFNVSDDAIMTTWTQNVYYQAFSNKEFYTSLRPFDPSTLCNFRKRVGKDGLEIIFAEIVRIHGPECLEKEAIIDSTVQGKYTTYPTDTKLRLSVINQCNAFASHFGITFDSDFSNEVVDLKKIVNFTKSTKSKTKLAQKNQAIERIKEISNILLDELSSKVHPETLNDPIFQECLSNYRKAVNQGKDDNNKIYSIFEPHVACIPKGKAHTKFEFGSKTSIIIGRKHKIILGVSTFTGNPYDGDTIFASIEMMQRCHNGYTPEELSSDLGYRGRDIVLGAKIITPDTYRNESDPAIKLELGSKLRSRSSIEPIIGHLKSDHSLRRNLLHGIEGDHANALLAAVGFNCRKYLNLCGLKAIEAVSTSPRVVTRAKNKTRKVPFLRPEPIRLIHVASILPLAG